jgi:hypothetical protein
VIEVLEHTVTLAQTLRQTNGAMKSAESARADASYLAGHGVIRDDSELFTSDNYRANPFGRTSNERA